MTKRKQTSRKRSSVRKGESVLSATDVLVAELRGLIEGARERVSAAVNAGLLLLYWEIGQRIHIDILNAQRATYGDEIVPTLSAQLVQPT